MYDDRQSVDQQFRWLAEYRDGYQFGEQGMLIEIFRRMGKPNWRCVEIGAGTGVPPLNLTLAPFVKHGLTVDAYEVDDSARATLEETYKDAKNLKPHGTKVTPENVDLVVPDETGLVVLDVDGAEFYILQAMGARPAVLVVEHEARSEPGEPGLVPPLELCGYRTISGTKVCLQADEHAIRTLAESMGYTMVARTKCNGIYVRADVANLLAMGPDSTATPGLKLNLGGGDVDIPGYENVDRKFGKEVFPLAYPDNSADEIYASHVLEHFPMADVPKVLAEWVRVLKPGGRLRVSVPDSIEVMRQLTAVVDGKARGNVQLLAHVVIGGQTDENDFHKAVIDTRGLEVAMRAAGLWNVQRFAPFVEDNSRYDFSANIEGRKPVANAVIPKTIMVRSVPREGPTENLTGFFEVTRQLGIPVLTAGGAYYDLSMERLFEQAIDAGAVYVLATDYDSVFTPEDVKALAFILSQNPKAGAVAANQVHREKEQLLTGANDANPTINIIGDAVEVGQAHFGLTLIRVSALKDMPRPWFRAVPNEAGRWSDGHVEADVQFWRSMTAAGWPVLYSPRVAIGHLQRVVSWPTPGGVLHQYWGEWTKKGKPKEVAW